METCFADQPLTKLTEAFKNTKSIRRRREILKEALPLCQNVPDVRMLYTNTEHGSPLQGLVARRWDEIMLAHIEDVSYWTRARVHRVYLKCRSGSLAEKYITGLWGLFDSANVFPRCSRCRECGKCRTVRRA